MNRLVPSTPRARLIPNEPNMALMELETDVLVAGGGLSGVLAAHQSVEWEFRVQS